jgi:hypothetical protein
MFTLADLVTRCEVAAALARKAARLRTESDRQAELFAAMSRVFSRQAAGAVGEAARLLASGFAPVGDGQQAAAAGALTEKIAERFEPGALAGMWTDMVTVGESLKALD